MLWWETGLGWPGCAHMTSCSHALGPRYTDAKKNAKPPAYDDSDDEGGAANPFASEPKVRIVHGGHQVCCIFSASGLQSSCTDFITYIRKTPSTLTNLATVGVQAAADNPFADPKSKGGVDTDSD